MTRGKLKTVVAAAIAAVSCPIACGGSIGMSMGEGPQPNGSIGQPAWQFPAFIFLGLLSLFSIFLCVNLVMGISGENVRLKTVLIRLTGLYPFVAGAVMIYAGGLRIQEGIVAEGIAALAVGIAIGAVGAFLVRTRADEFR